MIVAQIQVSEERNLSKRAGLCILYQEEISACVAVHMQYLMDVCDPVQPIILCMVLYGGDAIRVSCANKTECQ